MASGIYYFQTRLLLVLLLGDETSSRFHHPDVHRQRSFSLHRDLPAFKWGASCQPFALLGPLLPTAPSPTLIIDQSIMYTKLFVLIALSIPVSVTSQRLCFERELSVCCGSLKVSTFFPFAQEDINNTGQVGYNCTRHEFETQDDLNKW